MIKLSESERKLHFWTVMSWMTGAGLDSKGISIYVSPKFLQVAKLVEFERQLVQKYVRILARESGYRVGNHEQLVQFGQYGIHQIKCPNGDATWLQLDMDSLSEVQGAEVYSKNLDHFSQQSFLFRVWVWWAGIVAAELK